MKRTIVRDGKQIYRLSQAKIKDRKKQLRALNNNVCHSWRVVQSEYYPEISYQLLQAFADGKRIPSTVEACKALDLIADANPYRAMPKWWERTPKALAFFMRTRGQIKQMFDDAKAQRYESVNGKG